MVDLLAWPQRARDSAPGRPDPSRAGMPPDPRADDRNVGRPELAPRPTTGRLPVLLVGVHALIVDDDPDILELFKVALTVCGAEVTTATNARDAFAAAQARRPTVLLSDLAMAGEDGYWLVREFRASDALADVPALAVTAYGREHSRARALLAGFQEHLQKPVDPEALCRTIARLLGR